MTSTDPMSTRAEPVSTAAGPHPMQRRQGGAAKALEDPRNVFPAEES